MSDSIISFIKYIFYSDSTNKCSVHRLAERRAVVEFEGAWKILFDFNSFLNSDGENPDSISAPFGGANALYPVWLRGWDSKRFRRKLELFYSDKDKRYFIGEIKEILDSHWLSSSIADTHFLSPRGHPVGNAHQNTGRDDKSGCYKI